MEELESKGIYINESIVLNCNINKEKGFEKVR